MSPTFIGHELEKTDKVTKDKSFNEEKETADSNLRSALNFGSTIRSMI